MTQVFLEVDYSQSGEIRVENLKKTYQEYCGKMLTSEQEFNEILEKMQQQVENKKGLIKYALFSQAKAKIATSKRLSKLKKDYDIYDYSRDHESGSTYGVQIRRGLLHQTEVVKMLSSIMVKSNSNQSDSFL